MPRPAKRRTLPTGGGDLPRLSITDGAVLVYDFSESTGNLLNRGSGGSTYDISSVDSIVSRRIAAPGKPDLAGVGITQSAGSAPGYGHAIGVRPSIGTWTKLSFEMVLRSDTSAQDTRFYFHMSADPVYSPASLACNADGNLQAAIALTGGYVQPFSGTATLKNSWTHVVWQYDGADFTGYINGVLWFTVTTTIGSPTFTDVPLLANRYMAYGGQYFSGTGNTNCSLAFFAHYPNMALSASQVGQHYRASGV